MAQEFPREYKLGEGLSPEAHKRTVEGRFASICTNLRLSDDGYYPIVIPTNSITNMPSYSWPYPQIFEGKNITIIATATSLFTLNAARDTATALTLYDATNVGSTLAIQAGSTEPWHFASIENYWYMTNGQTQVFSFPGIDIDNPGRAYVANSNIGEDSNNVNITIKVQSVAVQNNRFVFGGITGVSTDVSDWATLFNTWRYNALDIQPTSDQQSFGSDWLLWGEVGGGDVDWPFAFIMQLLAYHTNTTVTRTREFMLAAIEDGRIGMTRMPAVGTIKRLENKGQDLLVFSSNMTSIARAEGVGFLAGDSTPHGIAGRGAYAAGHFIDQKGELINALDNFKVLGYETELSALTAASISMVENTNEAEMYISDGTAGYVFSRFGLAKVTTFISGVLDGNVGVTNGASNPNNFSFQTLVENHSFNGIKTSTVAEVIAQGLASVTMYISFWEPELAAWVENGPIYGSPDLTFTLAASGSQFKYRIDGTLAAGDKLERLLVRYQFAEGKSVRGPRGTGLGRFESSET